MTSSATGVIYAEILNRQAASPMNTYTMNSNLILITASTPIELELLIRYSAAQPLPQSAFSPVYSGTIGKNNLLLAVTGMGKVNAAASVAALLAHYTPRLIINTGCAGAYHGSDLNVGELAVASTEIYGDEGVMTTNGWQGLELIGIPLIERGGTRYYNDYPLNITVADKVMHLAISMGIPIQRGHFVTVSTCSGTKTRGEELASRFNAICENMEGAAVAQVALINGVDCLEIRGISNMVEDRDLSRWDIPLAVENVQRFLLRLLESDTL
jgi:futalosine hydrolase